MKKLEISKKDLKFNIDAIKKTIIGKDNKDDNGNRIKIIAVVKANGMGLGLIEFSKFVLNNGIHTLAVSTIEEALELREAKIDAEILMLSPVSSEKDINTLLDNKIVLTVGSLSEFEKIEEILEKRDEEWTCHIKIDTGLGRYGFLYEDTDIIDAFEKSKRLKIVGTFTHFSKPINERWTRKQFERFLDVVAGIRSMGYDPRFITHLSNYCCIKI